MDPRGATSPTCRVCLQIFPAEEGWGWLPRARVAPSSQRASHGLRAEGSEFCIMEE